MGQTSSKVVLLPLAPLLALVVPLPATGPDATAAPPPVLLPLGSCANCWAAAACTPRKRWFLRHTVETEEASQVNCRSAG